MEEEITGTITNIIYVNNENYFVIALAKTEKGSITIKGVTASIRKKMDFKAKGVWVNDKVYGEQFNFSSFDEMIPTTLDGIERYLCSGMIKGIGPVTAKLLTKTFGEDTLNVMDETPEKILDIKGIGEKKAQQILESIKKQKSVRTVMLFLKKYNITDSLAAKIYKVYGNDTIKKITDDPYRISEDIHGIGFKKADEIAMSMGVELFSEKRIVMGLLYTLNQASESKDTFLTEDELVKRASSVDILNLPDKTVRSVLPAFELSGKTINDEGRYYIPSNYHMECALAKMISERAKSDMFDDEISTNSFDMSKFDGFSDEQKEAIRNAATAKIMVLTGGPGTGKTTTLKGILEMYEKMNLRVLLAAPTGRAAKRMSESTGRTASTIHRLLEWQEGMFTRNQANPLSGDALVVDECSMINLYLMHSLVSAMPKRMKLILVGDVDQLPPIGCGSPFRDMINSECIPVARLTKIYRQSGQSKIITNAHLINSGKMPDLTNSENTDFFFFRINSPERMREQVLRMMTGTVKKKFGFSCEDIQVLTPTRKITDQLGSIQLNNLIQSELNPEGEYIASGPYRFRNGDKVMQNTNNYELGVFNGDIGKIISIDTEDKTVTVSFQGMDEEVVYTKADIDELELAYATTVHKSQGSEYPAVIVVADRSQYIMLQRTLFYTAVTRAKKACIVISNDDAVRQMVYNKAKDNRNSYLMERIVKEKIKN